MFLKESTNLIDINPIKFKDDTLTTFKKLKVLQTNKGRKFRGKFDDHFQENGISHEVTIPYSPEQNGKAERVNTIIRLVGAILAQ